MVTGDNQLTSLAIAEEAGLLRLEYPICIVDIIEGNIEFICYLTLV